MTYKFAEQVSFSDPTQSYHGTTKNYGDTTYVPLTQRGPIGGITTATISSSPQTLPGSSLQLRWTLTVDVTVNVPSGTVPADGQVITMEILASGAQRTVTFASGFEVSQAVPGRVFVIPSATYAYITLIYRNGTTRLVSAEPQTAITVPTLPITSQWLPGDHGLLAWTFDPMFISTSTVPAAVQFGAIKVDQVCTISNVLYDITSVGATLTSNRNFIGLYSSAGSLVASTADQTTFWTSLGVKTTAFTTPYAASVGTHYLLVISTGTTRPGFASWAANGGLTVKDIGRTTASYRSGFNGTAQTALPGTMPAMTGGNNMFWFGLS